MGRALVANLPHPSRRAWAAGVALSVGTVILVVLGAVYFRVDLFDDYRAGYRAGTKIAPEQTATLCGNASIERYGAKYAREGATYPDSMVAFAGGCFDASHEHLVYNPWRGVRAAPGGGG